MRFLGAAAAAMLGVAIFLAPAAAGAPHRPTLQQAVFDVIVEGSGIATHEVDGDGTNGLCQVSSHTRTSESYEYGRGKGFAVVFKRFRGIPHSPVFLTREGRGPTRPTFNVRGSYEDFAEGQATREGPAVCEPVTEAVGDEPECKHKIARAIDMALVYGRGKLALELADPELTRLPGSGCGSNSVETLSGWPLLGWGGFPELDPEPLSPALIFGHRHGFVIHYRSEDGKQTESPNPAFQGRAHDTGEHEATVRFVRR